MSMSLRNQFARRQAQMDEELKRTKNNKNIPSPDNFLKETDS